MKNIKSHFVFTKTQRYGIFLLLLLIFVLQCIYFFVPYLLKNAPKNRTAFNNELQRYEAEIDSLKKLAIADNKPSLYPFNPNYITDYKGAKLGMSVQEIDRLLAFRKQNKWINSAKEFQDVTGVSDTLLASISPYFKFPEWINTPKAALTISNSRYDTKTLQQKKDLNIATEEELQRVSGVGAVLSKRIVNYRSTLNGGFASEVELQEVYGLSAETIQELQKHFTVKTPRQVSKLNLNTVNVDALVTLKYIDYEIANQIIEYRTLHERFTSLDELLKVKDFPKDKIEIIKLSLHI